MSGGAVLRSFKYALAGGLIGSVTGIVTDAVYDEINKRMPAPSGSGGNIGRLAISIVGASALASTMIYAGDMVIEQFTGDVGEDPLFRLFYYQTAFHAMRTTTVVPAAVRSLFNQLRSRSPSPPPPRQYGGRQRRAHL